VDLADEEVAEPGGHLGVGDVHHLVVNIKVDLGRRAEFFSSCLVGLDVAHLVLKQKALKIT